MPEFITQTLGWVSTALVLIAFYLNAMQIRIPAFIIWIIGDILWVIYDFQINNYSHLTLSAIIVILNFLGIFNEKNKK